MDHVASSRQQRRERSHVVSLERLHVTFQQRSLFVVHRAERFRVGDGGGLERGVGPLQGAVHRSDRRVQQLRDLRRLPAEHITEHEHRSLLRRQELQRRDEREADRIPDLGRFGGVTARGQHAGVGHRQDPRGLGERLAHQRDVRLLRRSEVHRTGSALLAAQHVEADVRRDAVQPGAQRRPALEPVEAPPRSEHRLLHGVLGLERRAEHAVGVRRELSPVQLQSAIQVLAFRRTNHASTLRGRREMSPGTMSSPTACRRSR
jgi:hypothetical protein